VFQGKFTTEAQRARRFLWGYLRTHSQTVRASSGSSRRNTSILKQLPRPNAEFPNALIRGQPFRIHHRGTEDTKVSFGGSPEDCDSVGVANTSILRQLPRTDAEFPNVKKRRQPLQQTFFSPADLGVLCASVVKFLLPASYRSFGMNSFALETLPTNLDSRETHRSISTKSTISTVECMYRIGIETSALGMPRLVG
jgi:hypothetical protein